MSEQNKADQTAPETEREQADDELSDQDMDQAAGGTVMPKTDTTRPRKPIGRPDPSKS